MLEPLTLLTARDLEILGALALTPLTAEQLCTLSQTFARPFHDPRRVRERLKALADAKRVCVFRYAIAGPGAPAYYTLTSLGYRLLYGPDAALPVRSQFMPIGIARQRHAFYLAEFLVRTMVAAHRLGVGLTNYYRENSLRLSVGSESLFPDAAFQLIAPAGKALNFLVELDNSTERINSDKETDSWQRKINLYEAHADHTVERFRVLIVVQGSQDRLERILKIASRLAHNPRRSLIYGVTLDVYRRDASPISSSCWINHRLESVALLPSSDATAVVEMEKQLVRQVA